MRHRLFIQIYVSFLGVSLLTLAAGTIAVSVAANRALEVPKGVRVATQVVLQTLPDPTRSPAEFRSAAVGLARKLGVQGAVWSADGALLARVGEHRPAPPAGCADPWIRSSDGGLGVCFQLPDDRWVAITAADTRTRGWALRGGGVLLAIFGAIAVGCWPLARRITRRLEALQVGVEAFGAGDLERRVDVRGHDEVAAVARSFNASADQIAHLVATQRRVLAHASHELRSPLARLRMYLALLEDGEDPVERTLTAADAAREVDELDALIADVLLASRLQNHTKEPDHSPVAVGALITALADRHGAEAKLPPGPCPTVLGDERLLKRALTNLLINAGRHGAPPVEIALDMAGATVRVQVSDRGPGLAPADVARIFEPFFRPAGHTEGDPGVGLGLALVDEIARHHGGEVSYQPREGGGATFTLALPRA